MKVFSLKKYMEWNNGKSTAWAEECDGQPVKDNMVKGKDGKQYYCCDDGDWSEEIPDTKVIFNGKATVLIKDGKKYVSKCKDGDTYDKEKGLLLCLAQANGISYKDLQEMIAGAKDNNLEKAKELAVKFGTALCEGIKAFQKSYNGEKAEEKAQVREVKRKAKVGEYIKIVYPQMSFGDYDKGDIFKVVKVDEGGVYREGDEDDGCTYIFNEEYVVLENYTPYKITLSKFWKKGVDRAVNAATKEQAAAWEKACKKAGYKSRAGVDEWETYKAATVYYNDGCYDEIGYANECGVKVYNFDEVDLEN